MLAIHIVRLGEETLAKKVWNEQVLHGWPGLGQEVSKIVTALSLDDGHDVGEFTGTTKDYRILVTEACRQKDEVGMKKEMEGKTKAKTIIKDDCRRKKYLENNCLSDVRQMFAIRNFQLPFAGNYKTDRRFQHTDWKCHSCEGENGARVTEDQSHVATVCTGYDDLRNHYDLDTDDGLIGFYRAVLKRRDENRV